MNSETASPHRIPPPDNPTEHFAMRFSSTPTRREARPTSRRHRLDAWGIPYKCATHHALTLIVAELAANAIRHGRIPGRDCEGAAQECALQSGLTGRSARKAAWRMIRREKGLDDDI